MGHTSVRRPARSRRRVLTGIAAAAAVWLAALVAQAATTSAQSPSATQGAAPVVRTATVTSAVPSSFLGGRRWDEGSDVEVDAAGNTYVTGFTLSQDFPSQAAAQGRFAGLADGFVTKVAPDGRRLWSTFLGGVDVDIASSLAVDAAGNVYVTGRTASPDFPTTGRAFQTGLRGGLCQGEPCHDAFVTKLSPQGRVVFSTLLGGSANEEGVGIAVDRRGRAWVTGNTDSADLPLKGPLQGFRSPPCPGDLPCEYDVFVAALRADGRQLAFSTYLGGGAGDTAGGIAVDEAGSAYVTGTTRSQDFPVTRAALQGRISGSACGPPPGAPCLDAFVVKITGGALAFSTYFGGTGDERSGGIAVDRRGRPVITGSTRSARLPVRNALQAALDDEACRTAPPEEQCGDAFVTRLTGDGRRLLLSTYLGGRAEDQGLAVAVEDTGDVVVAGRTDSRDFPVRAAAQPRFGGYIDGFATRIADGTGALVWSTFVGGSKADRTTGVDTHRDGRVRLTGRTLSPDFPTVRPFQPGLAAAGDDDAFVQTLR